MAKSNKSNHKTYHQIREYAQHLETSKPAIVAETYDKNSKVFGIRTGSLWVYLNCENSQNVFVFDERLSARLQNSLDRTAQLNDPMRTYKSSYSGFQNKGRYPPGKSHSGIAWRFENWRDLFKILEGSI